MFVHTYSYSNAKFAMAATQCHEIAAKRVLHRLPLSGLVVERKRIYPG